MTDAPPIERPWSIQRWLFTVILLLGLQTGLAWWLSDRGPLRVREETRRMQIRLVPDPRAPDLIALLKLKDPTRFVLPSREGFSGTAWLDARPLQHRSPGWSNPPQWLQPKPEELLADFRSFAATNQPGRATLSERLSNPSRPRLALEPDELPGRGTRMRIGGALQEPDLVRRPSLPDVEYAGVLSPTVVSILVDQRGRVFQATLATGGSSGATAPDQLALRIARSLQFVTDPRIDPARNAHDFGQLREGRITFDWWTVAPSGSTNKPALVPAVPPVTL